MSAIAKLRPIARSWGGDIIEVSALRFNRLFNWQETHDNRRHQFSPAPFIEWHGVLYDKKLLFVVPRHASPNALIHEMGHVFACLTPPDDNLDETSFLAWEVLLARSVGLYREWSLGNSTYAVDGNGSEWSQVSASVKAKVVRESLAQAIGLGSVDPDTLTPRAIR